MAQFSQNAQSWLTGNKPATTTPTQSSGFSSSAQQWLTKAPAKRVATAPVKTAPTPVAKKSISQSLSENPIVNTVGHAFEKYAVDPLRNAPEFHFADKLPQYTPVGFAANFAQGFLNTPQESAKSLRSLRENKINHTATTKEVVGDIAGAIQLPLLLLSFGGGAESKGIIGTTQQVISDPAVKALSKQGLKIIGKAAGKELSTGGAYGLLGGLQSGKDIKDNKEYVKNILTNIGFGAAAGVGIGETLHVVLPLVKGGFSKLGAVFVKGTKEKPVIERVQLDPKAAQSTVMRDEALQKSPAGKQIMKASVIAQQTDSHVAIIPTEEGGYKAPNGKKVDVKVVAPYEPSNQHNPVPSTVVKQTEGHTMTHLDELVSVKDEPRQSIDNAHRYMDESSSGKGEPREPLKVIKLQNGKHLIIDGNATYHAAKEKGHTHIPTIEEDITKWDGNVPADEHVTKAAKEHFTADSRKREIGKLFTDIADKFGLKKVGEPGKSDVKSVVGIVEKRHFREDKETEVRDVLRDTIIINSPEDAAKIVAELRARGYSGHMFNSERRANGFKDRYGETHEGYKDANYQFTTPDGQVVELQMMQKNMHEAKGKIGHHIYDLEKAEKHLKTEGEMTAYKKIKEFAEKEYHQAYLRDNNLDKSLDLPASTNADTNSGVTGLSESSLASMRSIKEELKTLRQASSAKVRSAAEKVDSALDSSDIHNSSKQSIAQSDHASNTPKTPQQREQERYKDFPKKTVIESYDPDTYKGIAPENIVHFNQGMNERVTLIVSAKGKEIIQAAKLLRSGKKADYMINQVMKERSLARPEAVQYIFDTADKYKKLAKENAQKNNQVLINTISKPTEESGVKAGLSDTPTVYHGAQTSHEGFKVSSTKGKHGEEQIAGVYFSDNPEVAKSFSQGPRSNTNDPVKSVQLAWKNPLRIKGRDNLAKAMGFDKFEGNAQAITNELKKRGYDGVVLEDNIQVPGGHKGSEYIVLNPQDIRTKFSQGQTSAGAENTIDEFGNINGAGISTADKTGSHNASIAQQSHVAQQPKTDLVTKTYDANGEVTKVSRPLNTKETQHIQQVIDAKLKIIRETADNPNQLLSRYSDMYKDITERAKGDKVVLSSLRTQLDKEMYGIAGVDRQVANKKYLLEDVIKNDPETGKVVSFLQDKVAELDDRILTASEPPKNNVAVGEKATRPVKQTGFTGAQEPVGTGKLKQSRAYKRLLEHLEQTDPETFAKVKDDPKLLYNTVNQKYDFENAAKIVEENPQKAYNIAKQYEPAPANQRWESVNMVLADRALEEKNYATWKDLEQSRSLAQTRKGQGIVAERGRFNDDSPHTLVQRILDQRLKNLGKSTVTTGIDTAMQTIGKVGNSAKEKAIAKIDATVEKAIQFTKKERTKIDFAQKLLDELTCK